MLYLYSRYQINSMKMYVYYFIKFMQQFISFEKIFKELLSQAKIAYNLSPAVRRRRQSLPHQLSGNGSGGSSSAGTSSHTGTSGHCSSITMTASNVKSHAPTPAQLQHLQRIQEHSLGSKRNSCIIS